MFTLAAALAVSAVGFRLGCPGTPAHWPRALLRHLCLVTAATLTLEEVGARLAPAALYTLAAGWLAALAVVHVGHAVAVAHWGARLGRASLVFALRNGRDLAATFRRQTAGLAGILAVALAVGMNREAQPTLFQGATYVTGEVRMELLHPLHRWDGSRTVLSGADGASPPSAPVGRIEDGAKRIRFEPPAATLTGERIHQ